MSILEEEYTKELIETINEQTSNEKLISDKELKKLLNIKNLSEFNAEQILMYKHAIFKGIDTQKIILYVNPKFTLLQLNIILGSIRYRIFR